MNILIIGLGSVGKKHLFVLKKNYPNSTIFALRTSFNSENISGVINVYSFEELDIEFDFIIIAAPTFLHEDFILKSLKYKCPLFIEKPILHSLKNKSIISQKLKSNNILTYTACNMRFHPCILKLRDFIKQNNNSIIEVNVYCGSYLPNWRMGVDFKKTYSSSAKLGGGVHLDLIHELDYCIWIFGKPNSVKKTIRKISHLEIDSFDYANYLMIYNNFTINITLNYYRKDAKRQIEVVTKDETIIFDLISNKIENNKKIITYYEKFEMIETYEKQLKYFIDNLNKPKLMMNTFEESVETLKFALND